jgi:hypothetical protein
MTRYNEELIMNSEIHSMATPRGGRDGGGEGGGIFPRLVPTRTYPGGRCCKQWVRLSVAHGVSLCLAETYTLCGGGTHTLSWTLTAAAQALGVVSEEEEEGAEEEDTAAAAEG